MSNTDTEQTVIDLVINQDPQGVQDAFNNAITDVIADKLDDRKVQLAKEMFSDDSEQVPTEDDNQAEIVDADEDDQTDEIEGEDLTDEEWNELIASLEDEEQPEQEPSDEGEQTDDEQQ